MAASITGERIKQRRKEIGLSVDILAERVGVSRATMYRYENGDIEKVPVNHLRPLAKVLNTSVSYLMGWDESPTSESSNLLSLPSNTSYPLVGDIACGTPILSEENITEYIQFPDDMEVDFCLRCRGDSMVDARIYDGDIVFIRQQPEVENGEIAAVLIGEETTLKRVYRSGDTLTLIAANSAYAPMVYTGEQLAGVRILGKAVSFLSTVK